MRKKIEKKDNKAIKFDNGKPDLSMISYELISEVAKVRMFGAKKYTVYGECQCPARIVKENVKSGLKKCVNHVITQKMLKIDLDVEQNIKENIEEKIEIGSQNKKKSILKEILGILQTDEDQHLRNVIISMTPNLTNSFLNLLVQYVDQINNYALTTTIKQEQLENDFVRRVISHWELSNAMIGSIEHLSTCEGLKIIKSGRDNWKLGFKVTRSLAAALRHIFLFLKGETYDEESGLLHLAHAVCCLEHAIYDMLNHPENDDRYKKDE